MRHRKTRGFSLIELLIVIAIIAVLMGLLLPAIQKVRVAARKTESANNLKQMALAVHAWHDVYKILPPTVGWDNPNNKPTENGVNGTVFFMLMPFLDYGNYYQQFFGTLNPSGTTPAQQGVPAYRANLLSKIPIANFREPKQFNTILDLSKPPSSPTGYPSFTSYLANQDLLDLRLPLEKLTKGTTNVMLFTEGMKSCLGNVYDFTNHDPNPMESGFQVSRTNNWAVGTEVFNQWTGQLQTTIVYYDYSNLGNPPLLSNAKPIAGSLQIEMPIAGDPQNCGGSSCDPFPSGYQTAAAYVKGNIPAFFRVDTYYTPWSTGTVTWTNYVNNVGWSGTVSPDTLAPHQAAYQDGRSPSVNPAVVPSGTVPPTPNCLWFAAQAHYGSIRVAMTDGSVRSVDPAVTPNSWGAAISPTGGEVSGTDFWE